MSELLEDILQDIRSGGGVDNERLRHCLLSVSVEQRVGLLNIQDRDGNTAIHYAAVLGSADTIKYLLDGVSVEQRVDLLNIQDSDGDTAIHHAAEYGSADTIKYLLDSVSVEQRVGLLNIQNSDGNTAIHYAAVLGSADTIKYLLDGVSVEQRVDLLNIQDSDGDTAIHRAAVLGSGDTIKYLLDGVSVEQRVALLNIQNSIGDTAIHRAAWLGSTDTIKYLLDGVSVEQRVALLNILNSDGNTAIHRAAMNGSTDANKYLLDGVSVEQRVALLNIQDSNGNTAIHRAAWLGSADTIKFLLDGISVEQRVGLLNIQNSDGNTAIHRAAWLGSTDTIKYLLDGVSGEQWVGLLKIQNSDGDTAMHRAAWEDSTDTIKYLLDSVSGEQRVGLLKIQNSDGDTAMHDAARKDNTHFSSIMVLCTPSQQAELLGISNSKGQTALEVAVQYRKYDVVEYINECKRRIERGDHRVTEGSTASVDNFWQLRGHHPQQHTPQSQLQIPQAPLHVPTPQLHVPTPQLHIPTPQLHIPTPHVPIQSGYTNSLTASTELYAPFHNLSRSSAFTPFSTDYLSSHPFTDIPHSNISPSVPLVSTRSVPSATISSSTDIPAAIPWQQQLYDRLIPDSVSTPHTYPPQSNDDVTFTELLPVPPESTSSITVTNLPYKRGATDELSSPSQSKIPRPQGTSAAELVELVTLHSPRKEDTAATPPQMAPYSSVEPSLSQRPRPPATAGPSTGFPSQPIISVEASTQTASVAAYTALPNKTIYERSVRGTTIIIQVRDTSRIFSFEGHMTVGELCAQIKDECPETMSRFVLGNGLAIYAKNVRLNQLETPFSVVVDGTQTVVTDISRDVNVTNRAETSMGGQQPLHNEPSTSTNQTVRHRFRYVNTPELALDLMNYVHDELSNGRAKSINDALKATGKCRKTIDRFRFIYYLHVLDREKFEEVRSEWKSNSQKGGMVALSESCEEVTDWLDVEAAANNGRLTIFGKKRD